MSNVKFVVGFASWFEIVDGGDLMPSSSFFN